MGRRKGGKDMRTSKFAWCWMGLFCLSMVLGVLWHFILFRTVFLSGQVPEAMRWYQRLPAVAAAELGRSFLLVYLFPFVAAGSGILKDGLRFGLLAAGLGIFAAAGLAYGIGTEVLLEP